MIARAIGLVAVGTIAAGILRYFINETNKAKIEYEHEKEKFIEDVNDLHVKIERIKKEISSIYNPFEELHPLYVASIKIADNAYNAKNNISSIIKSTYARINEVKNNMDIMYKKSKLTISQHEKEKIHIELSELKKLKNMLYEQQTIHKNEKEKFMKTVYQFNNETHNLKNYIRDNCGNGGRIWYDRKQAKIGLQKNK